MEYLESRCNVNVRSLSGYAKYVHESRTEKQYNWIDPMVLVGVSK
jgi:hypothetical protein